MAEYQHVSGLKELEQNLKLLGRDMHEKGVKRMMSRAAVPMRENAKQRARGIALKYPERRESTFAEKIRIWRKRATRYAVTYYVGISRRKRDPFWWLWVEFGIPSRGVAARPFLRPAFEATKQESVQVALDEGRKFVRQIRFKRLKGIVSRYQS